MIQRIYYIYIESQIKYGTIFWRRDRDSAKVFHIKNKVIHLISGVNTCDSCRHTIMEFSILSVALLYILWVLCFIKTFKGNLNIIFIFMAIIQQAKLIYIPKVVIKIYFRKEM
jgi:hypothetical protein